MMIAKKFVWPAAICASLALGGCGSVDGSPDDAGAMPEGDDDAASTGLVQLPPEETESSTTEEPPDPTEEPEGTDDGCSFINCNDMGPPVNFFECDMFAQDCGAGEKCMPWANDGSGAWNATRCVPVVDNPNQPGDQCLVEGSGTSGLDDCDVGSMCWDVDIETNIGTCVPMCTGDAAAPLCEDPDTSCTIANEGAIVLCLPTCDPLLQDCADGQGCYPIEDAWNCAPDASGEMGAAGDPCEYINVCDPGNVCLGAAAWPDCAGSAGCCSPVCDVESPDGDAQCPGAGQSCEVWYAEGTAPPGYEAVGVCALPG